MTIQGFASVMEAAGRIDKHGISVRATTWRLTDAMNHRGLATWRETYRHQYKTDYAPGRQAAKERKDRGHIKL